MSKLADEPLRDGLRVGEVGALVVPTEDVGGDYDDGGDDIDMGSEMVVSIRKPGREEWITLHVEATAPFRLYRRPKDGGNDYDYEYYYIEPGIRGPIEGDVKAFRVTPYYSHPLRRHFLYVTPASAEPGTNAWSDSLAVVLKRPREWHAAHTVRIRSNLDAKRYDIRSKPAGKVTPPPTADTQTLLGAAIGPDKFIRSTSHPVYQSLIEGDPVT